MEEKTTQELTENSLQLVITEKTLGTLTTNANIIRDNIRNSLVRYENTIYDESNIDIAKKDKAMLNKASKYLDSERIAIEKEFMQPFQEFKGIVADTVKLISDCSTKIDVVVKNYEGQEKQNKYNLIEEYFNSLNFTLVSFKKLFDNKWLNKTSKLKQIELEIDAKIQQINNDIDTLKTLEENVDLLLSVYLDSLDISKAIQYANQLKANRERVKLEEENRKLKEEANRAATSPKTIDATPIISKIETTETKQEVLTRYIKVRTTKEKLILLADFMNENGIIFEKIEKEEECF